MAGNGNGNGYRPFTPRPRGGNLSRLENPPEELFVAGGDTPARCEVSVPRGASCTLLGSECFVTCFDGWSVVTKQLPYPFHSGARYANLFFCRLTARCRSAGHCAGPASDRRRRLPDSRRNRWRNHLAAPLEMCSMGTTAVTCPHRCAVHQVQQSTCLDEHLRTQRRRKGSRFGAGSTLAKARALTAAGFHCCRLWVTA